MGTPPGGLDDLPIAALTLRDGVVTWANAAAAAMLAVDEGVGFTDVVPVAERERVAAWLAVPSSEALLVRLWSAGEPRAIELRAGASGAEWIVVVHDVTESLRNLTALKAEEEKLRVLATHDTLTGLANRLHLTEHLRALLDDPAVAPASIGLLFCDLDDFKRVNDDAGHEAGDRLLKAVAARLQAATRAHDLVARIGGDEFVVVCERINRDDGLAIVRDRVVAAISEPVELDRGRTVRIGVSVGIARADASSDADGLLNLADQQMYAAKRQRKLHARPAV